ncbi:hypothetical protein F511_31543 [Dorcoceras hygrometricum]|uniref:Uncharacterized protein n=1 Tax=Dorcoceras hygrometricum TaxID=472368 RepID=A0A2Z7BGA3_9LAMI|nr:hypothetical protein F511_31543 [Dorcoceras hygrometricum]
MDEVYQESSASSTGTQLTNVITMATTHLFEWWELPTGPHGDTNSQRGVEVTGASQHLILFSTQHTSTINIINRFTKDQAQDVISDHTSSAQGKLHSAPDSLHKLRSDRTLSIQLRMLYPAYNNQKTHDTLRSQHINLEQLATCIVAQLEATGPM